MILTDNEILEAIKFGNIVIKPFDRNALGTNSYDIHLGNTLAVYNDKELDAKKHNTVSYFTIPEEGFVLQPGQLYLGATLEYTETHTHVPFLEGKSSTGRLGINIHATAGKGDVGFCNHWTLEISCLMPVRIYPGMPIAQIFYFKINHENIDTMYNKKQSAKYNEITDKPVESMMWKNFNSY
jgi:dCTP deaminase